MARPRKRFCPKGHDKDAENGSTWFYAFTAKGTPTLARSCTLCLKEHIKNWKIRNGKRQS